MTDDVERKAWLIAFLTVPSSSWLACWSCRRVCVPTTSLRARGERGCSSEAHKSASFQGTKVRAMMRDLQDDTASVISTHAVFAKDYSCSISLLPFLVSRSHVLVRNSSQSSCFPESNFVIDIPSPRTPLLNPVSLFSASKKNQKTSRVSYFSQRQFIS